MLEKVESLMSDLAQGKGQDTVTFLRDLVYSCAIDNISSTDVIYNVTITSTFVIIKVDNPKEGAITSSKEICIPKYLLHDDHKLWESFRINKVINTYQKEIRNLETRIETLKDSIKEYRSKLREHIHAK